MVKAGCGAPPDPYSSESGMFLPTGKRVWKEKWDEQCHAARHGHVAQDTCQGQLILDYDHEGKVFIRYVICVSKWCKLIMTCIYKAVNFMPKMVHVITSCTMVQHLIFMTSTICKLYSTMIRMRFQWLKQRPGSMDLIPQHHSVQWSWITPQFVWCAVSWLIESSLIIKLNILSYY